jgi:hypothetical protein
MIQGLIENWIEIKTTISISLFSISLLLRANSDKYWPVCRRIFEQERIGLECCVCSKR